MDNVNVLFVDDNKGDLVYFEAIIELDNLPVNGRFISDPEEAMEELLKMAPEDFPEIIIVDYNMPRLNGFDMIENLFHKRKDLPNFPNAYINSTSIRIADKNRINSYPYIKSYLEKPIPATVLHQLLIEVQHEKMRVLDL